MWRIRGSKLDPCRQSPSDQNLCWEEHSGPPRLPYIHQQSLQHNFRLSREGEGVRGLGYFRKSSLSKQSNGFEIFNDQEVSKQRDL